MHITLWHRTLKEAFCVLMLAIKTWSVCLENVWSQIYQGVAGMRFPHSLQTLCYACSEPNRDTELTADSTCDHSLYEPCAWCYGCSSFLQAPPLPVHLICQLVRACWCGEMTVSDHLEGLYCCGSEKGSVRQVLLTNLLVKFCDRGSPV